MRVFVIFPSVPFNILAICPIPFSSSSVILLLFLLFLGLSTPSIDAKASSSFIYFCAFKSISAIVLGGFFTRETMNSLDFNPTLKVVSCTLSFASSTSKVSRVKCVTYYLGVSFSPCLMVSKWSISFLISLWRSELTPFGVPGRLFWLSPSSSQLVSERLSSCWSCSLISWFCLVSSFTLATSVWICKANAAGSWLALDSIWTCELNGTMLSNLGAKKVIPHKPCQTDDAKIVSQVDRPVGELNKIA